MIRSPSVICPRFGATPTVLAFAALLALAGCDVRGAPPAPAPAPGPVIPADTVAPQPGGGSVALPLSGTRVRVSWGEAQDDRTAAAALRYRVERSEGPGAPRVERDWTAGSGEFEVEGLSPATAYTFVVSVSDEAGNAATYAPAGVSTPDDVAPVPGAAGEVRLSATGTFSCSATWDAAVDPAGDGGALEYRVVWGDAASDLSSPDMGTVALDWTAGVGAAAITLPTTGRSYRVNAFVRDGAGNVAAYLPALVALGDAVPPVAGGPAATVRTGTFSFDVAWPPAADDATDAAALEYAVVRSAAPLAGAAEAAASGAPVMPWTTAALAASAGGVPAGGTWWITVLVRDSAGNLGAYSPVSIDLPDLGTPEPGGAGALTALERTVSSVTLSWEAALDDVSPPGALEYKVVRSPLPDVGTLAAIEGGAGSTAMDWTPGATSFSDSGLAANTWFHYSVLVRDAAGHVALYGMTPFLTLTSPDQVFLLAPGDGLADHNFVSVSGFDPVTPEGWLRTSDTTADTISTFTTPEFPTLSRLQGGGLLVEWKTMFLGSVTGAFAERNKFWVTLLDADGQPVYQVHWKPLPSTSDVGRVNKFLFAGPALELLNTTSATQKEGLVFPSNIAPGPALWVSWRLIVDSTGVRVWNDLTADRVTTNGNPIWSAIATPDLSLPDVRFDHVTRLRFQYQHSSVFHLLLRDFGVGVAP